MAILVFSPQSKTFVAKGSDGRFAPIGSVRVAGQGIINVNGKATPGPAVIARERPVTESKG
jgi:hypothetical protein